MKNYHNATTSTTVRKIPDSVKFQKITDLFPTLSVESPVTFPPEKWSILGYIKTHSDMYDKDQYSLYIAEGSNEYLINVPSWYGSSLEDDFKESKQTAEEFFNGAYLKEITMFKTKYNKPSYNITIYE